MKFSSHKINLFWSKSLQTLFNHVEFMEYTCLIWHHLYNPLPSWSTYPYKLTHQILILINLLDINPADDAGCKLCYLQTDEGDSSMKMGANKLFMLSLSNTPLPYLRDGARWKAVWNETVQASSSRHTICDMIIYAVQHPDQLTNPQDLSQYKALCDTFQSCGNRKDCKQDYYLSSSQTKLKSLLFF